MNNPMTTSLLTYLALSLSAVAFAQGSGPEVPTVKVTLEQIKPEALRAHTRFLADDLLEGRGTGTRGYELAAKYVAAQFEALGLEPAGTNKTYFQTVPLRKLDLVPAESSLSLMRGGQSQTLQYAEDYMMDGDFLHEDTGVSAPVVFVGFGVTAPELDYDDYTGIDVRGKVVAQMWGAPASFPNSQRAYYSSPAMKEDNAAAHGAVAVLRFLTPARAKMWPWDWLVRQIKMGANGPLD